MHPKLTEIYIYVQDHKNPYIITRYIPRPIIDSYKFYNTKMAYIKSIHKEFIQHQARAYILKVHTYIDYYKFFNSWVPTYYLDDTMLSIWIHNLASWEWSQRADLVTPICRWAAAVTVRYVACISAKVKRYHMTNYTVLVDWHCLSKFFILRCLLIR